MKRTERQAADLRIEITGELDAHAAEALWLEFRRLAKRYGAAIDEFRVEEVADDAE